jgi:hypothetical protein
MAELPIACSLTTSELHARQEGLIRRLVAAAVETAGEEGGYRFRLPPTERSLELAFDLIRAERACCPFLRFELRCEPGDDPIELSISGPAGTRSFLDDLLAGARASASP